MTNSLQDGISYTGIYIYIDIDVFGWKIACDLFRSKMNYSKKVCLLESTATTFNNKN